MIEVTGKRGRIRIQLLDGLKEKTGYWKLIRGRTTLWRNSLGRPMDLSEGILQNE
jgi:hypothetical protein